MHLHQILSWYAIAEGNSDLILENILNVQKDPIFNEFLLIFAFRLTLLQNVMSVSSYFFFNLNGTWFKKEMGTFWERQIFWGHDKYILFSYYSKTLFFVYMIYSYI